MLPVSLAGTIRRHESNHYLSRHFRTQVAVSLVRQQGGPYKTGPLFGSKFPAVMLREETTVFNLADKRTLVLVELCVYY